MPLSSSRLLGVVGLQFANPKRGADPEVRQLLQAWSRIRWRSPSSARMAADLENLRVEAEGEKLRTALLNSLSHDLRTPLVSIIGALSGLVDDTLPAASRVELTQTGLDEARRLDRYVQNL